MCKPPHEMRNASIEWIASEGSEVFDRTLDRRVANSRAKIEVDAQHPHDMMTVYGVLYKLADSP